MSLQDREMKSILCQLQLVSTIPAKSFDASHGTDDDPGGRKPPGDYGYRVYMDWYTECRNDKQRGPVHRRSETRAPTPQERPAA